MDNGRMHNNPLIPLILTLLRLNPEGISEHQLIKQLQEGDAPFPELETEGELALFQKHFLVMNALYRLQSSLSDEGFELRIDPLKILLLPRSELDCESVADSVLISTHDELRSYYLDWNNLQQTTQADVSRLLQSFWDRYYAVDRQAEALCLLGLDREPDALKWAQIQRRYRQLANRHHPDKGGDGERFIEIREAYELLRQFYGRG